MNMVLQTCSPLFPGYLSRNKTAQEIDEDDPDLEIDCDLPMTKCTARTPCISVHHSFIVCIPSAILLRWIV